MNYLKMLQKGGVPAGILILAEIVIAFAKMKGIELDPQRVLEAALAGYAGLVMLINWIKNHKKPKV